MPGSTCVAPICWIIQPIRRSDKRRTRVCGLCTKAWCSIHSPGVPWTKRNVMQLQRQTKVFLNAKKVKQLWHSLAQHAGSMWSRQDTEATTLQGNVLFIPKTSDSLTKCLHSAMCGNTFICGGPPKVCAEIWCLYVWYETQNKDIKLVWLNLE